MTFAATLLLPPLVAAAAPPLDRLPVQVIAWDCSGEVGPGSTWIGAQIEIRRNRIRFVEVALRFRSASLPPDEARWFEPPTAPALASFSAWEQYCSGECFEEALATLLPEGTHPLADRAIGGRSCTEAIEVDREGEQHSKIALQRVAQTYRSARSGLAVHPDAELGSTACRGGPFDGRKAESETWIDERHDLDRDALVSSNGARPTAEERSALARSAREMRLRLLKLLGSRRPEPSTLSVGPDAARLASVELLDLGALCSAADDEAEDLDRRGFPGDFSLFASVAPPSTLEATAAVEARFGRNAWDREVALRLLGDHAAPRHRDAIAVALEFALASRQSVLASLALRALLRADPLEAKRRAEPLLEDSKLWRSAAGVFVLSDPALARRFTHRDVRTEEVREEILRLIKGEDAPAVVDPATVPGSEPGGTGP